MNKRQLLSSIMSVGGVVTVLWALVLIIGLVNVFLLVVGSTLFLCAYICGFDEEFESDEELGNI